MSTSHEEPLAPSDSWPPAWFGAVETGRTDLSERIDDILRDELGRRPA